MTYIGLHMNSIESKTLLGEKICDFFHHSLFDIPFPLTEKILRFEIEINALNLIDWLHNQKDSTKIYWLNREETFEVAGIGEADVICGNSEIDEAALFSQLRLRLSDEFKNVRYYGGIRFTTENKPDDNWKKFASFRFIIPRIEIVRVGCQTYLACNLRIEPTKNPSDQLEEIVAELNALCFDNQPASDTVPHILSHKEVPDKAVWEKNINVAFDILSHEEVKKIVLARKSIFKFSTHLDPIALLRRLKPTSPESFHFCFQIDEKCAFIGASPERLYRREGQQINSEAIAGTCRRGNSPLEDYELGIKLLMCDKNRHEHRFVLEFIKNAFNHLCTSVQTDTETSILKLPNVQHLYNHFEGTLANGITDAEILSTLHPTPAVGGYPKEKALLEIEKLEPFDRGWYAAPVGWVGKNDVEFAVAIRSGLVKEHELALFSGAGIVAGSTADEEWSEIDHKLSNFIKVIQ
ncbi:MAG: isochorismate synthase [bacterium]